MIDRNFRHYIEYRPELHYIYEKVVTPRKGIQNGKYIFSYNGSLASDASAYLTKVISKVDNLILEAEKLAGPLYDEYVKTLTFSNTSEKFARLQVLEYQIANSEGNIAAEMLPILEEMKTDFESLKKLFDNTVGALLDENFPEGELLEKEIQLDQLMRALKAEKLASGEILATLSMGDLNSPELKEKKEENYNVNSIYKDACNLSYTKTDMSNVVEQRCAKADVMLTDVSKFIHNTPQNTLDKQLLNVLQYILENINPFNIDNVKIQLEETLSLLDISLNDKVAKTLMESSKMKFTVPPISKTNVMEATENCILYRSKVSSKQIHLIKKMPADTSYVLNSVLSTIADGVGQAEKEYKRQILELDKITSTDLKYKTKVWDQVKNKELTRTIYNVLQNMINYIDTAGIPLDKPSIYDWVVSFCRTQGYNICYDANQKSNIDLF